MTKDSFWTDERVAFLRDLKARGSNPAQIAYALGATVGQVVGKLDRLGLLVKKVKKSRIPGMKSTKTMPLPKRACAEGEPEPIGPWHDFPARGCCRFIDGTPGETRWRCCGHPATPGSPYCSVHERICFPAGRFMLS